MMTNKGKRFYYVGLALAIYSVFFGSQIATTQNRENDSLPPAPAPAAGVQYQPQISKGANSSLVVWSDQRNIINKFTSRDANEVGSLTDIYAARYDAQGNLVDTTPLIVSQAIYSQRSPHVAWNGQNWLVAWITERANFPFTEDVHAVRVAPDGRVLDASPIVIGVTPSSSSTNPSYLDVASDGVNWIVVWGTGTYDSQIRAARIAPDGTLIDTGGGGKVLYDDTNLSTAPGSANIAFIGNQFLLVWDRVTFGGYGIRAQRFNQNLDEIDPTPFVVNQLAGSDATAPSVATDGVNYFVTWREDRFAYNEIFGTRISTGGQVLDPNGIKLFGSPGDYISSGAALTWDGTAYVAAYHARPVSTFGESVFASRVTADGTVSAPIPIANQTGATQPAVAPAFPNGAQIVWTDRRLSSDGDIFTAALSTAGTVGAATPVSLGAPRETRPRFAVTAAGNFALVFRSTVSGTSSILFQRLNSSGNAIDENPVLIASGTEAIINPSVAWNGANYLVVWEFNGQTFGRRVGADGVPIGAEFLVSVGNTPDVAALDTQFLVVNSFPRTTQLRHTQATRVGGDGTVNLPVRIGNNFDLRPRVRAFGTRWLAVWESDISHDNPNSNIAAAFVNPDGTSPGEFSIGSFGDDPHFAVAGNTALVVWEDGNDIRGRRISADGTFPEASKILADAQGALYNPAVAWDGARFVLSYADSSRRTSVPPADIWATLIGIDGAVLTLGGFPVADSPLSEEQPAIEGFNGTTLFGFAKFEDRPPFAAFRIRLRRFPFDRDFFVSTTPFARTIAAGLTTTYTVNITAQNNFNQPVNLSVDGLPNGVTAVFNPPTIFGGSGSSTLTITTATDTPEGIYTLTINAASGAQQSQTRVSLIVDDNPPPTGFTITNLGTLGGSQSEARAVNDNGQIVGWAFNASQQRRAFFYTDNQMRDLGTFGGTESYAYDINNSGQIVGWAKNSPSNYERAFVSNGTTLQPLGTLGGDRSYAYGINNAGQITGSAAISTNNQHAFLYQNGVMQDLGVLGGFYSYGFEINAAGKIVGFSYQDGNLAGTRAVVYQNSAFTSLGTLGGRDSSARSINDSDQIVGSSAFTPDNGTQHAFLYQNGAMQDLGTLGTAQSYAYDINNAGKVVGSLRLTLFGNDYQAFLYDGSEMRNLNSLIPVGSGWNLNEAFGINNVGQIVGRGIFNNQPRAFLLSPTGTQNSPPSVQITSPSSNGNLGDSALMTITASAFDADGMVTRVEFYDGANLIGTATSNPFVVLWNAAAGTHVLTAKAFDNAGAATVSVPVTVTVGTTATARTPFDFDGDGKADVSVFRPSNGVWYLNQSTSGFTGVAFGYDTDKIVPADYDGDGKTDIAVFRSGTWYLQRSQLGFTSITFGASDDVPVPADYDADGKSDIAVFRPSNGVWYIQRSTLGFTGIAFGANGDKPIAADYDGDGKSDIAVFRPSNGVWYLQRSQLGFTGIAFGDAADKPVPADYDGDGKADIGVFRPSNGVWYLQRSNLGFTGIAFGLGTDAPVPADYDGDGKADVSVFRDGIWYMQRSQAGFTGIAFGAATDRPVINAFVR